MFTLFALAVAQPSKIFAVGQKVIWHYKARTNYEYASKVPAEVVKLGAKRVQIMIKKNQDEFITRWVDPDKLETLHR